MLLSEYMLKFVERKKGSISPVTYTGYTNMVKGRIRRFFDPLGVTINTLTPQLIEDFLDSIADEGYNGTTQLRYYQIIGACLKNALRKDHIDRNPMKTNSFLPPTHENAPAGMAGRRRRSAQQKLS